MRATLLLFVLVAAALIVPAAAHARTPRTVGPGFSPEVCDQATRVEVDLTTQSIYVYEGGRLINSVERGISTTNNVAPRYHAVLKRKIIPAQPVGCFKVEGKDRRVYSWPYRTHIYFPVWFVGPGIKSRAYAIHCVAASKVGKLGQPDSGGCVRTPTGFCRWFYAWVRVGVPVRFHGEWQWSKL